MQALHVEHDAPADEVSLDPFARVGACLLRLPADGDDDPVGTADDHTPDRDAANLAGERPATDHG